MRDRRCRVADAVRVAGSGLWLVFAIGAASAGGPLGNVGSHAKWHAVEIQMTGPSSVGTGTPNPFAVPVDVLFTSPGGTAFTVPAFYDGDGSGGLDGNVWKVRFSADEVGTWSFASSSSEPPLDGYTGTFTVTDPPANAPDFYRWGRLSHVGTPQDGIRYLKFRDGPYWLKAGSDDPENFLGSFSNYDTPQERMAAVDYLAARGVNSMYIMTDNVGGDNGDVWPWLGSTSSAAQANAGSNARFDVVKLQEWLELFEHMQRKGVVPYLILEDDSAWTGYDHARYYREMIARFGHLPALLFNLGEEAIENYPLPTSLAYMSLLESLDPYDHPRAVHNVNLPDNSYVDATQVDFTAIQTSGTDPLVHNQRTIDWIDLCRSRNRRVLMVGYDEPRPLLDRRGWWSAYIGGGVWEVHVTTPYDRPMSAWEPAWTQIGGARAFMETLPFREMNPDNSLVTSGSAFCLAKPGAAYALYLPHGGSVTVNLTPGVTYTYDWWNPANGRDGSFQGAGTVDGGARSFDAPAPGDWVLRIVSQGGSTGNIPPLAFSSNLTVAPGESASVSLAHADPDGPGPYAFSITAGPQQGTLSGSGQTRTYTANADAAGTDTFRWRVNDGESDSNEALVTIQLISGNQAPVAIDQAASTVPATAVSIPLGYTDPDGPGPYTFTLVQQPSNGAVQQDNAGSNDFVYTPNPGFQGTDGFTWRVNDGMTDSNTATVTIQVDLSPKAPPTPTGLQID